MSPEQQQHSGWGEWSKHVLKELERLNEEISKLNDRMSQVEIEIAKLQVKASIWGGVTGLITTLIALALQYLKTGG